MATKQAEFLIVGGGVIGLSIARELHRRGARDIVVLDKGRVGYESSWAAAGMLAPNAEASGPDEFYRLCVRSNRLYPNFAAELAEETGVDIELDINGSLVLSFSEEENARAVKRLEWQLAEGEPAELLTANEALKFEPNVSRDVYGAVFYERDTHVENRKLVAALRRYCESNNIGLLENEPVEGLIIEGEKARGVSCGVRRHFAAETIVAAGAWTSRILGREVWSSSAIKPIRGQMICFRTESRLLNNVVIGRGGYIVPRADGRMLVGATVEDAGFRKEVTVEAVESLRRSGISLAPILSALSIKSSWAGLRPKRSADMPFIGRVPGFRNLFVASGHYRNGILLAPLTAEIAADGLLTQADPTSYLSKVFSAV